jgi:hypothetical protein
MSWRLPCVLDLTLMPIFAVSILRVGARGQGLLMGLSGIGSLLSTFWLSARSSSDAKGWLIIGSGITSGLSVATFGLTAAFVDSFPLALALMFMIGLCNATYVIAIRSSLQMLVPDTIRRRVMGFYGMPYNLMPIGGCWQVPWPTTSRPPGRWPSGGLAVTTFAIGPALLSSEVRHLGTRLAQGETATAYWTPG